ncbi:MAG: hypothetical protein M3R41_02150 [Pseudomonadota bacterium]|nr:hypothetical protein [Pseudomonadota bacterium]
MPGSDETLARAAEVLDRVSDRRRSGAGRSARDQDMGRRLTRALIADGAILAIAIGWGLAIGPIGMFGFLGMIVAMALATMLLLAAPASSAPSPERLRDTPLKALPAQTGRWLDAQRPALPAPAQTLIDGIGVRLDTLAAQLATLGEDDPAAGEVRKLLGEQLPEFIGGYARVPEPLRRTPRNGKTPDAELTDGLKVIDDEIAEMTQRLAQGDLDSLATRGRFLELKYRDENA